MRWLLPATASLALALVAVLGADTAADLRFQEPAEFDSENDDMREKRSYYASNRHYITGKSKLSPGGGGGGGGGSKGAKSQTLTFNGGCGTRPVSPPHTTIQCHTVSGCRLTCLRGHNFPNGETRVMTTCNNGVWRVEGTDWETIPDCMPVCLPSCQNNGICIRPNICNCTENYMGPQCQHSRRPCFNDAPLPVNSEMRCSTKTCTITCMKGHKFPDGSAITNLVCKDGTWKPSRKEWSSVPDCQTVCQPPCENGGNCLSFNTCQCPQDFKGPQCQYAKAACDPQKLNFNGHYSCKGDINSLACNLQCPGGRFSTEPADAYKCQYAIGTFLPTPVPSCIYDTEMKILSNIHLPGSTFFTVHEQSSKSFNASKSHWSSANWSALFNTIPRDLGDMFGTTTLEKPATPGSCYAWGDHYKTFDGRVISFQSGCSYTLVQDAADNTFSINLEAEDKGIRPIKIFAQDKEYTLLKNDKGVPILKVGNRRFVIPTQLPGVRVKYTAHFVELSVTVAGFSVLWDTQSSAIVNIKEHLWNKTAGLCGRIDGYPENDLQTKDGSIVNHIVPFASSWKVERLGETCPSPPSETNPCDSPSAVDGIASEASAFCDKLLSDPRFAVCRAVIDVQQYYHACRWDYCASQIDSTRTSSHEQVCKSIAMFVKQCNIQDVAVLNWRDATMCSMKCEGGRTYMTCNPENQMTCGSEEESEITSLTSAEKPSSHCIEGCYCPPGTVLHKQQCISRDMCPCQLRGRSFSPGHTIPKDCNTCTCDNGRWLCTQTQCSARCSCIGDPHYSTFDGKRYDFMGKCSYYLVKGENYSVEAENVACSGAISKTLGFAKYKGDGLPACAKSVTVKLGGKSIQLKQGREVFVDGVETSSLPVEVQGAYIHPVSSIYTIVELPNRLTIWWDGISSVYIDAPPSLRGKTKGLCGTFTSNQKDDFVTPEEDIEQSVISFANKWKTEERCANELDIEPSVPCDVNPHKREQAHEFCSRIRGQLFERCHWVVDPEPHYHNCMYDMCSCEQKVSQCLCPIIAAYAQECVSKGVSIEWRSSVRECGIHCPRGQQYQLCGSSCSRSCHAISHSTRCERQCVEGCNCPDGQTLNDETGECIPISQCPCQFGGLEFQPAQKEVRSSAKGPQLCTCTNAVWDCHPATHEEIKLFPNSGSFKYNCSAANNEEYTACLQPKPLTCKTMHNTRLTSPTLCRGGCACKKGFVLDHDSERCIRPTECPCHHGGRSYSEGSTMQEECNTCTCTEGKWKCTERVCSGVCSAWGDSHYKTFDSRIFDFHGTCDYLLAKGLLSNDDSFDVSIQNVECGSLGVSCSKSVTLKVGSGKNQESITFTKDKPLPIVTGLDRIQVRIAGLFIFAEITDLGVVLQWDQGTRVYVKVAPKWKGKVKGLCGNYNDDMLDDFQTPSGGIAEVSATVFGDSWRLEPYCPESVAIMDACTQHPNRKLWAMQKCGVLKSSLFQPCHSEVPVEPYLERCIFDSCACDLGGDCECLCTALAAYSQECNAHGVHIRWRSQNLCPMQCDEKCSSYSPCIDTCPKMTCENQYIIKGLTHLCKEDTCVEGCEMKPCPAGQVYYNQTALECVPIATCKTVCLEEGGVTYYEGDLMEEDACHTCYCSRHKKSCKGTPCPPSTTPPPQDVSTPPCVDGWTPWINEHHKAKSKRETIEEEPMPSLTYLKNLPKDTARCNISDVAAVECRVAGTLEDHKSTGLDVQCNKEEGLLCRGPGCPDFEIRILCICEPITTTPKALPKKCDVGKPNKPHEKNCYSFYQCVDTLDGPQFVEKTCGPNMMYDRESQVCDYPESVIAKWPQCAGSTVPPVLSSTTASPTPGQTPTVTSSTPVPAPITSTKATSVSSPSVCKPNEVWNSCGIPCHRVCLYFEFALIQKGFCSSSEDCIEGCFSEELSRGCPAGYIWRDKHSCVAVADCTCKSHSGEPVKPGEIKYESDCEVCQCINNQYVCDVSNCTTTEKTAPTTSASKETPETTVVTTVIPYTNAPPLPCVDNKFVSLVEGRKPLPNVAFSSNSISPEDSKQPHFARILKNKKNEYAWTPAENNEDQYLQINIGEIKPIYGVTVQGGPFGYVTSYKVLFSRDGGFYHYVTDEYKNPKIFRGPIDKEKALMEKFYQPVEAQYIRFNPLTWHGDISMRVEIFGCAGKEIPLTVVPTSEPVTSTTVLYEPPSEECTDEMGLKNGMMSDQQIMVSSVKNKDLSKYGVSQLRLDATGDESKGIIDSWIPALNDQNQWIQFHFIEFRNLTGFITQGSKDTNSWVEAFKVSYSHDGDIWNSVLDADGKQKIFPGNFDGASSQKNHFKHILRTQYLRLIPHKWHKNIAVRAEVIGCFEPYPFTPTPPLPTEKPYVPCQVCDGVPEKQMLDECYQCKPRNLWWDGMSCVNRTECPCFVDHNRYDVGKVYVAEDCKECMCKLNGYPECETKKCHNICEQGQRRVLTASCGCTCKPCPEGTVLCPTSNICINESFWCNGVEDCPDDERDCPTTYVPPITTTEPPPEQTPCPTVNCPPGTKPVKASLYRPGNKAKGLRGGASKGMKGEKTPLQAKPERLVLAPGACEPVNCVPITPPTKKDNLTECPKPMCPPSYVRVRVLKKYGDPCPFMCVPQPVVCNITHNTVDTFDGLEYKYEICNHILARDRFKNKWDISMVRKCSGSGICSRYLSIIQDEYIINLYPDMSIDLDGVPYMPHETSSFKGKYRPYAVYPVGDSLHFQSNRYDFGVIWDKNGDAKIRVDGNLYGAIEGLCGTFNRNSKDDRTTPDGNIASSNVEFGNSWAIPGYPECEITTCPIHLQTQAQEICNSVRKSSSLNQCSLVMDMDRFVARCLESTCACLNSANSTIKDKQSCHCMALRGLVTECQSADAGIDLSGWRTEYGCHVQCPPSFVYHDCYRHKCEASCGGGNDIESCDSIPGTCFSGCFCPDGLLRLKDQCISPEECRDCVCDGFGDPQYMSFDQSNFTFNGNCTYVASRDSNPLGKHTYQVLVTNKKCPDEPASTCTEAVEIHYLNHSVLVRRGRGKAEKAQVFATVDGKLVSQFPHKSGSWLQLNQVENSELTILIPPIQLEVTYIFHNYAFTVRLPSAVFNDKTEGLCGNCNRDKADDFTTRNGTLTNNTDEFGQSWLHPRPTETNCQVTVPPKEECVPLPPDEDPCLRLVDSPIFKKCRHLLDPAPYVAACQFDLCHSLNRTDAACRDMEAYVAACERAGVCLEWRNTDFCPFKCPPEREYRACQTACSNTCENVHKSTSNCSSVIPDGCYCPKGQVLHGGECVDILRCHPCDDEGHFHGDSWQEDKCTNCTCVGTTKECKQNICPDIKTICDIGMIPVEQEVSEKECCKKVTCVPAPTVTPATSCPPTRIPECRDDQEAVSMVDDSGCNDIVCKCKPCKVIFNENEGVGLEEEDKPLEEGMRRELDTSGCCPKLITVCHPEVCLEPIECTYPHVAKKIIDKEKCCPAYECGPPSNACLIKEKNTDEIIVRKIGSEWRETPCRTCKCTEISGAPEMSCDNVLCPAADLNPNVTANYELESKTKPGECCAFIQRTACKINNTILEPGKTFVEYLTDHCVSYLCQITDSGDVDKVSEIERCNTKCNVGWEYVKPKHESGKCCGECEPVGCMHDGVLYEQGKTWKSADKCTDHFCLLKNGTIQVDSVTMECPKLPQEILEDYHVEEHSEPGKCCKVPVFLGCLYNGSIYEAGESWISTEDPCKKFTCERSPSGQLTKKETTEICSITCNEGWQYIPASPGSRICCGRCQQVACLFEGVTYPPDSIWASPDGCTNHTCFVGSSGEYQVTSSSERCPEVTKCPAEKIYQDKCCRKCRIESDNMKLCAVQNVIPKNNTALIRESRGEHTGCINTIVKGFTECEGHCTSKTIYSQELNEHVKYCDCCQPQEYIPLSISMQCEDGYTYNKIVDMPSVCGCQECTEKNLRPSPIRERPVH